MSFRCSLFRCCSNLLVYQRALFGDSVPPTSSFVTPERRASHLPATKRWVRGVGETCVESMRRSNRATTDFAATFKFEDPQWADLLALPCGNPISLELRGRHVNYELRHLVQKGHALYIITDTRHSVVAPLGVAERAHITCAMGPKGDRLLTLLTYVGRVDGSRIDSKEAVVAISLVQGYATFFQRRPMLWQRSRRIGALQAELGAFDWRLFHPQDVGRHSDAEVLLLHPHTQVLGGGVTAVGIVSSVNIAQHPFHYIADFEAPATIAADALHQAAHVGAAHRGWLREKQRCPSETDGAPEGAAETSHSSTQLPASASTKGDELLVVGWTMQTPKPFLPLEADLHFRLQLSQPSIHTSSRASYPSSLVGVPLIDGVPVVRHDYNVAQGAEHYLYDQGPAFRSHQWWRQRASAPYRGALYAIRRSDVELASYKETIGNPFEERKVPLHRVTPISEAARRRAHALVEAARRRQQTKSVRGAVRRHSTRKGSSEKEVKNSANERMGESATLATLPTAADLDAAPWVEKYRPLCLSDVVGNAETVKRLQIISRNGNMPSLLLCGPPGTGKTTSVLCLARDMLGEAWRDAVLELNASDDRGLDVVRNKIKLFAQRKVTLAESRMHKLVILDEADSMTAQAQQALRRTMELYSATTRFAFACNDSHKIIEPIQSRCAVVRYAKLSNADVLQRVLFISGKEKVTFTDDGLEALLYVAEGDLRNAINALQATHAGYGKVDAENVFKVTDQPHPIVVEAVLLACVKQRSLQMASKELQRLMQRGYAPGDVIGTFFRVAQNSKLFSSERMQLEVIRIIGETTVRIAEGCGSVLQLSAMLCKIIAAVDDGLPSGGSP